MEQPTRLFEFIDWQLHNHPLERAMVYRLNGQEAGVFSSAKIYEKANLISQGLLKLGLQPKDKVATVIARNRPEWVILDLALMQIGVINVPVYPTISVDDHVYIFNEASVKYCFVGDDTEGSVLSKIKQAKRSIDSLLDIYTFDKTKGERHWDEIAISTEGGKAQIEAIRKSIAQDDLVTIIYTSGTTGQPKGVMLSHRNIVSNLLTLIPIVPMNPGDRAISFLPLNHIFEKVVTYAYMYRSLSITHVGLDNLGGEEGDLRMVKPHFFTCVPRLLEKVYEKIYNKGLELRGVKRALFFWSLRLTNDFDYDVEYSFLKKIQYKIADALIFKKWREALGGSVKGIAVGASPCPVKILRSFSAAGIPVREAYGMTELSPGVSINRFEDAGAKLGTVGPILDGMEVKIDASDGNYNPGEGEIMVSGPNIMLGYYKKPEETAKIIREIEGKKWLYTGDIGKFETHHGKHFLKITDRKKELFKTSGGKYIAPAPIEAKLRENFMIEQVMLVGDNQKFVSALIVPATDALKEWCQLHNITWSHLQEVLDNQEVVKKYHDIVEKYNAFLGQVEKIKTFRLIGDTWEPVKSDGSSGELTPTMKIKRRIILEKYRPIIDEIYSK